ncbi:MAG TPA: acyl-CoA carboxylase subunit epsilon [Mycobacterium sp.]|nr:acyl-CoA carboxylase subunit epsilon [Mycobacterium sp.]
MTEPTDDVQTDGAVAEDASQPQVHEPHIQILKGEPTAEEVAALIAVLGCAGGAPEPEQPEQTRWGLPVDRLRFAMSNFQRLTFQQMTHMRH